MRAPTVAILLASLAVATNFQIAKSAQRVNNRYRLPSDVKPLNYQLSLKPDLAANILSGSMLATVSVLKPVTTIKMNVKDVLILGSPRLSGRPSSNVTYDRQAQMVTLTFDELIHPGIKELYVSFRARINSKLSGVFRLASPTGRSTQSEDTIVATHFEPTDARNAFPCWDEPAMKATFDLTLIVPAGRVVLSNGHVESRKLLKSSLTKNTTNTYEEVKFARTPLMSTYLLAFVIGRFDRPLTTVDENGVIVSVYTPIGRRSEGSFSIGIANRTLPHFAKLFGFGYPLAKLDLVSLPDFPSAAMENWGLVLFHETSLLVSRDTPEDARSFTAVAVVHELAHQWFGNLVSPAWWSDLWLNEGFATWLSFYALDDILPGFESRRSFVRTEKLGAMRDDALEASHPIEADVQRPEDTAELFDSISYGKGAALLGMLHDWLGHESFFAGLRSYIRRHKYANADTNDLWNALEETVIADSSHGQPSIADVMRDWKSRKGFPVIYVSMDRGDTEEYPDGCVLRLRQSRYRLPGADRFQERWLWRIPISVVTQDGDIIKRVMTSSSMTLQLPDCGWVLLNPNAAGYYRTSYPLRLITHLLSEAADGGIGSVGRMTLLDDLFAMHAADRVWTERPLYAVHKLRQDASEEVWMSMLDHLYELGAAVSPSDRIANHNWHRYVHGLCSDRQRASNSARLQKELANCLDYAGENSMSSWAVKIFSQWLNGTRPDNVSPEMWETACRNAAFGGVEPSNFWKLLATLNQTNTIARRQSIIGCLGAFDSSYRPEIRNRLLSLALGSELQASEVLLLIDGFNSESIWRLLTEHWDSISQRFEGPYMLKQLINGLTFRTVADAKRISQFFSNHSAVGVRDAVRRQVERIILTAERIDKDRVELRFLANRVLGSGKAWRRLGYD